MAEKKTAKKENSQVVLEEILGDIKTIVSAEKETLFKVSDYKTIKLKKENLINSGKKIHSSIVANLNTRELEELIKKIVKSELKNLQFLEKSPKPKLEKAKTVYKRKSGSSIDLLTKTELLSLSKKNNLGLNSKNTKAEIIQELKQNKIEATYVTRKQFCQ